MIIEEERKHQLPKKELVVNQQQHLPHSRPLINQPRPYQQQRQLPHYQKQPQVHQLQVRQTQQHSPQEVKQQQPSPQPQLHQQHSKKSILIQREKLINERYKKIQPEVSYLQEPLVQSNVGLQQKQQWMSLEEVMKGISLPLPGVGQAQHSQPVARGRNSVVLSVPASVDLMKRSLRVRPPQQQPVIQHQETTC